MKVGYGRVSTHEQNLDLQQDALKVAGCGRIYDDEASGAKEERPGLQEALDYLRKGTHCFWQEKNGSFGILVKEARIASKQATSNQLSL